MKRGRAYIREQRKRIIKNRKKLVRELHGEGCRKHEGQYSKHHPYDCGKTDCMLCHGHKKNKACASKWKDEHGEVAEIIEKEIRDEMCDFGD